MLQTKFCKLYSLVRKAKKIDVVSCIIIKFMAKKNSPNKVLLNDDVLNFSVHVIKDLLNLNSSPNSIYGDKTIIYTPV
jgi:hypothetical protein